MWLSAKDPADRFLKRAAVAWEVPPSVRAYTTFLVLSVLRPIFSWTLCLPPCLSAPDSAQRSALSAQATWNHSFLRRVLIAATWESRQHTQMLSFWAREL